MMNEDSEKLKAIFVRFKKHRDYERMVEEVGAMVAEAWQQGYDEGIYADVD